MLDLDAKRAARAEARGENHEVQLGGETFELTPELPLQLMDFLTAGNMTGAVRLLLADPDEADAFLGHRPTIDDLGEIAKLYGVDGLGGSLGSPTSSASTGKR